MLTLLRQMKMVTRKRGMPMIVWIETNWRCLGGSAGEFGGVTEGSLCISEL